MKFLLLTFLLLSTCFYANAQSNSWFTGTWYGERTFPDARIATKALLRMEIDDIKGDLFTGQLIYMYPSDTTARLIRRIGGQLYGRYVIINKSQEIYRMDPRSRGFWSDCSHCPGGSSFYIDNGNLVLQIVSSGCGDSCNGTTTFRRKIEDYNATIQATVLKKFGTNKAPATVNSYNASKTEKANRRLMELRDSIKYFPPLLNSRLRVNFDPSKYVLPNTFSTDTAALKQQTIQDKTAKPIAASPKITAKDSMAINPKKSNDNSVKAAMKDSVLSKEKTPSSSTAQVADKALTKAPATVSKTTSPASTKDTIAASSKPVGNNTTLPAPVKDTIPSAITQRATSLVKTYQVSSPHIAVQLFDDGQIDGDAVSVYYNGKVIINNQTLTHKAVTFTLEASATNRHHEFILISESEGLLSPNTALMRIKAGAQQFELTVSSSSARNSKIDIDYVGE